jgi:hypothetical protein
MKNNSINSLVYLDTSVTENESYKYKVIYGNEFGIFLNRIYYYYGLDLKDSHTKKI